MSAARARYESSLRSTQCKLPGVGAVTGERLLSASDDFTMFLWCPMPVGSAGAPAGPHSKPIARLTGHVQLVNQASFSPDGGRLAASASFDKAIRLWDGAQGTFLAVLRGHVGPVYQVTQTPNPKPQTRKPR